MGDPARRPARPHHYRLRLYALSVAKLGLGAGASAAQVAAKVQANALAQAEISRALRPLGGPGPAAIAAARTGR